MRQPIPTKYVRCVTVKNVIIQNPRRFFGIVICFISCLNIYSIPARFCSHFCAASSRRRRYVHCPEWTGMVSTARHIVHQNSVSPLHDPHKHVSSVLYIIIYTHTYTMQTNVFWLCGGHRIRNCCSFHFEPRLNGIFLAKSFALHTMMQTWALIYIDCVSALPIFTSILALNSVHKANCQIHGFRAVLYL